MAQLFKKLEFEDGTQNRLATQVGWPAFKRARRLKWPTRRLVDVNSHKLDTKQAKVSKCNANEQVGAMISPCDKTPNMNSSNCHRNQRTKRQPERRRNVPRELIKSPRRSKIASCNQFWWAQSMSPKGVVVFVSILLLQLAGLFHNGHQLDHLNRIDLQSSAEEWASVATRWRPVTPFALAEASLIIGDSAIEIQELDDHNNNAPNNNQAPAQSDQANQQQQQQPSVQQQPELSGSNQVDQFDQAEVVLGTTNGQLQQPQQQQQVSSQPIGMDQQAENQMVLNGAQDHSKSRLPSGPLPPLSRLTEDITDGDKRSRASHDFELGSTATPNEGQLSGDLSEVILGTNRKMAPHDSKPDDQGDSNLAKTITGKVVDFELQPAGGHNKAKIKKKKKKKKKKEEEMFKKWGKKKKMEKKAMEKEEKKHMKKKKEEGKKGKKKWGHEEHGQKKKGNFKKKKWGKKVKKGKGVKKGKKGKKFLKDKGHKNTGFKTVYHKEEWGKSSKWHDIKREKKWDEKSKKWKKKWKKEKGKKYKGDHMKKFEKKKKEGKKYKKAKKEHFKKFKKEEFEKGKKKKMEEHKKKKEGGVKKEEKKMEKKKKKKKP